MKKTSKTIKNSGSVIFFGTGSVASRSLRLLSDNCSIEAVITKPKPPHHKGNFPVIKTAEELKLPIHTVTNGQDLSQLIKTVDFKSNLGVLIDFGIMVTQDVIDYFPLGIINSHFSLLPELRGADPITFSILSGQEQTGVSLMLLVKKMDAGPLLAQSAFDIPKDITAPDLTECLIELSNVCLKEILPLYIDGNVQPYPQEQATLSKSKTPTYSRQLTKEDGIIDWNKSPERLEREIRAFIDWPKSRTKIFGKEIILTKAHALIDDATVNKPGNITVIKNMQLIRVECKNGYLFIEKLKPVGKKEMTSAEFCRGYADTSK